MKALNEIGFEHYLQAELTGWVLYLEGSTDLSILRAFARKLQHPAESALERPFIHYVGNQPMQARQHFWGLREACPYLRGYALFDRLDRGLPSDAYADLAEHAWTKREIENYFCTPDVPVRWAASEYPLFRDFMRELVDEIEAVLLRANLGSPWDGDMKVSERFFELLFRDFAEKAGLATRFAKADYHFLVNYIKPDEIDSEVVSVLDAIADIAANAVTPS